VGSPTRGEEAGFVTTAVVISVLGYHNTDECRSLGRKRPDVVDSGICRVERELVDGHGEVGYSNYLHASGGSCLRGRSACPSHSRDGCVDT
jgi:hypothetical protein